MTDHDALLRAIVENPAEDTPRLAFADWLDENAGAFQKPELARGRAAFIRDDIAASRRDEFDPLRLRWALVEKPRREREPWVKETFPAAILAGAAPASAFRRGFPWCLRTTPSAFLADPERLTTVLPAGTLSLVTRDREAEKLFRSPHFARFAGLHADGCCLRTAEVKALVESPHAANLEELRVGRYGMDAGGFNTLLRSGILARPARFELSPPVGISSSTLNHFHRVKSSRLREASFARSGLSGALLERFLSAPLIQTVSSLSLAMCRLGANGYEELARAKLPNLRDLDLGFTTPGADGFRALFPSPILASLRRLAFPGNHVNRRLAAALADCAELSNLRVLDLSQSKVGNDGAAAIARSPHLAGLVVLDLSYSQVGDEGVEAILESPLADGLVLLDLRGSPASEEAKESLKARMGDRVRL